MKLFIAICMVALAAAEPEADAHIGYGSALGYSSLGYSGIYPGAYAGAYSGAYAGAYSPLAYSTPYAYGAYGAPAAIPAVAGGYASAGRYVANSAGIVHVAKREAEADASIYGAGLVTPYGAYGGAYGAAYTTPLAYGAGYSTPYAYGAGYTTPYAYGAYATPAAIPAIAGGYAAAGRYVANSAGIVHVAKREAEADASLIFGAGLATPYGAYGGAYGAAYTTPLAYGAGYGAGYRTPYAYGAYAAPAAVPAVYGGYAAAGRYVANSAGVVHIAK